MKLRNVKVKYVLCQHLGPCQWENKEKMEEDDGEKEKRRNGGNMSASSSTESRAVSKICRWGLGSKFREQYIHEKDEEIIGYDSWGLPG